MDHVTQQCPCRTGDVLYRITDSCRDCKFETEVCQQRTCRHYRKYVEPMTVKSIAVRQTSSGNRYYVCGEEEDALYGWTAFRTREEAETRLDSFN